MSRDFDDEFEQIVRNEGLDHPSAIELGDDALLGAARELVAGAVQLVRRAAPAGLEDHEAWLASVWIVINMAYHEANASLDDDA